MIVAIVLIALFLVSPFILGLIGVWDNVSKDTPDWIVMLLCSPILLMGGAGLLGSKCHRFLFGKRENQ